MRPLLWLRTFPDRLKYRWTEGHVNDLSRAMISLDRFCDARAGVTRQWADKAAQLAEIGLRLHRAGVSRWDYALDYRELAQVAMVLTAGACLLAVVLP